MSGNKIYTAMLILVITAAALLISLIVRAAAGIFSKRKKPMAGFYNAAIAFCLCAVLTVFTNLARLAEALTNMDEGLMMLYRNLFVWLLLLTLFLFAWSIWLFKAARRKRRGEESGRAVRILSALVPGLLLASLLISTGFHGIRLGSDIALREKQYSAYLEYGAALEKGDYGAAATLFRHEMNAPTKHNDSYWLLAEKHLLEKQRQYENGEIAYQAFKAMVGGMKRLGGDFEQDAKSAANACAEYIELDKMLEQGDAALRDGKYQAAALIYREVNETYNFFGDRALAVRINKGAEKLAEADEYAAAQASGLAAEMKYEEAAGLLLGYHCTTFAIDDAQFIEMSDTVYKKLKEINARWARALADKQEYGQAMRVLMKTKNGDNRFLDEDLTEQLFSYKELYYPVVAAKSEELEAAGQPSEALALLLAEADCFNYSSYGGHPYSESDEELNKRYRSLVMDVMNRGGLVWLSSLPLADKGDNEGTKFRNGWGNALNEIYLDGYYDAFVEYKLNGEYLFMEGRYLRPYVYQNGVLSTKLSAERERKPVIFLDGVQLDDAYYTDGGFHIPLEGVSTLRIAAEYFSTGNPYSDVVLLYNVMLG